jgi:hypothetical protein
MGQALGCLSKDTNPRVYFAVIFIPLWRIWSIMCNDFIQAQNFA